MVAALVDAAVTVIAALGTQTSRRTRAQRPRRSSTRRPARARKLPSMRPCSDGDSRMRRFWEPLTVIGNESRAGPKRELSTQAVITTEVNPSRVFPVVHVVPELSCPTTDPPGAARTSVVAVMRPCCPASGRAVATSKTKRWRKWRIAGRGACARIDCARACAVSTRDAVQKLLPLIGSGQV